MTDSIVAMGGKQWKAERRRPPPSPSIRRDQDRDEAQRAGKPEGPSLCLHHRCDNLANALEGAKNFPITFT